jgi:hypothetical protein
MEMWIGSMLIVAITLIAIRANWIFHAPDGFALPMGKRPGILRFYLTLIRNPLGALNSSAFW